MIAEADPNLIVFFNGHYVPLRDARVGILTHALHYGTGVFEGIRAYWDDRDEQLFLMRPVDHYRRWKQNCAILRIDFPLTSEELSAITVELLRRNAFRTDIYVRPLAYKSAERIGVSTDDQDAFAIVALPFGEYLHSEMGLHAGVSSWRRIDDNAIPPRAKICGAYVNSALATDDARRSGFDEAILLNQSGHVAEGATCNLFMIRSGSLITPPATENILEGITRDSVMELARREFNLQIVERPIARSELYICDELFLTGTAVGIAPVVRVDHRPIRDGRIGLLTRGIREAYCDAALGRLSDYRHWLVPASLHHPEPEPQAAELEAAGVV
ncbi:MAG TPA: branched-chain amino acid transaminase [Acidobacteriaceae bacterium]|jgi:branched-chain amino acid aminotransferase|nr:branched-chain amino acid transaminase [Acidobacteriaceae bacterium]